MKKIIVLATILLAGCGTMTTRQAWLTTFAFGTAVMLIDRDSGITDTTCVNGQTVPNEVGSRTGPCPVGVR